MALKITPTRTLAFGFLAGASAVFAINHWYFLDTGSYYPFVIYAAPVFAFLGLGGLVEPKLLLALEGDHPVHLKAISFVLALSGLICAFILHMTYYGF